MTWLRETWARLSPQQRRGAVAGAVAVVIIAVVGAALAFSGGGSEEAATTTTAKATTTTTTKPPIVTTTTEPPKGPVAPLTGLRVGDPRLVARPAIAVKIDNLDAPSESAVPQSGLPKADIVFEEIVEGNITRLVGIFHSQNIGGPVGPVRSARTTDIHLLPQLGHPLLAWSGGNDGVVAAVHSSPFIVDVGADRASNHYFRDHSRKAPHNLYVRADELWSLSPPGDGPPPALFTYRRPGQKVNAGSPKAGGVDINWGGAVSAPVSWRWDKKLRLYIRSQRGRIHTDASGTPITAKNIVVLTTEYGQSPADMRSPEAHTTGGGEAFVYTNGRVVHGHWARPDEAKPGFILDVANHSIPLSPGQTWIELPRAGNAHTVF
jgi:hypothetical protein